MEKFLKTQTVHESTFQSFYNQAYQQAYAKHWKTKIEFLYFQISAATAIIRRLQKQRTALKPSSLTVCNVSFNSGNSFLCNDYTAKNWSPEPRLWEQGDLREIEIGIKAEEILWSEP